MGSSVWGLPSHAEADVGKTDTTVNEQNRKTGKREKPVEDVATILSQIHKGEAAEQKLQDDHIDGTALFVDLGEEVGCHTCVAISIKNEEINLSSNIPLAARA
jgi:hypothetical protein